MSQEQKKRDKSAHAGASNDSEGAAARSFSSSGITPVEQWAEVPGVDEFVRESANSDEELSRILSTLSHNGRRKIIQILIDHGPLRVNDLANRMGLRQPAVSQHLSRMRQEGLIQDLRQGKSVTYRIADPRLRLVLGYLNQTFPGEE